MFSLIKQAVRKSLGRFGYEIRRSSPLPLSAFAVQKLLLQRQCSTILDVGANVGMVTKEYRALFPTAIIHAFEPFAESFDLLVQNTSSDHNVVPHRLAVGDRSGACTLNSNTSPATNSILQTHPLGRVAWGDGLLETQQQVEVQMTTIDCFASENNVPMIDILKMDIQGAELIALHGAKELLSQQAISLIYLEIILADTYSGQPKLHEYLEYLHSLRYGLLDVYNPVRKDLWLIQVDAIFISNTVREQLEHSGRP